ncbi:hypothetical protein NSS79_02525 [Paenibacillus sp. FSL L8-0436]|uniref:hypothetical protein n=1 Tax=Paenibacillus sp. FSL L8-0436 TaxID=2954686 RepID=UPI0031581D92
MKKLLSLLTTVIMVFLLTTPVFASTSNNEKDSLNVSTHQLESSVDPLASFNPDPEKWLEWFNSLPEEVQLEVNYRPAGFDSTLNKAVLPNNDIPINETQYSQNSSEPKEDSKKSVGLQLLETMVTGGYEHPYDISVWAPLTDKANCYAYMLNISTYSGHKLQPGEKAGNIFSSLTTTSIINAAQADMPYLSKSIRSSSYSEVPGYREYKVALVIAPNYDYHWYRQDADGGWSHKRGLTAIDFRDASGISIRNPQTANRNYGNGLNYSTFSGWYIIKY